ncbi:hypothetical protein OPQ81_000009 [Rhizoctonia solani]|nr:hypothetical protein OPQ81_000009 [Rhizoctonia solani]
MGIKGITRAKTAPAAADRDSHPRKRSPSRLPQGPPVDVVDEGAGAAGTGEDDKKHDGHRAEPLDDGTDDYLHRGFSGKKAPGYEMTTVTSGHADIQSMQETAEITGKVVLLSRGGCGFLEKVKWAQRRGAVGVIVGDNQRGGPLIQMFARGDTSNITIPAIFTSRTTAHLLSSLMQPGSFVVEDLTDEHGNPTPSGSSSTHQDANNKKTMLSGDDSSGTSSNHQHDQQQQQQQQRQQEQPPRVVKKESLSASSSSSSSSAADVADQNSEQPGWLARLFGFEGSAKAAADRSRPPSSGQHDWVLVDDWSDEKDKVIRSSLEKASRSSGSGSGTKNGAASSSSSSSSSSSGRQKASGDGFQIGVQDWRDPDLVDTPSTAGADKGSSAPRREVISARRRRLRDILYRQGDQEGFIGQEVGQVVQGSQRPQGGSITPGSGQYVPQSTTKDRHASSRAGGKQDTGSGSGGGGSGGLMSKIFGDDDDGADFSQSNTAPSKAINTPLTRQPEPAEPVHEGLYGAAGGGPQVGRRAPARPHLPHRRRNLEPHLQGALADVFVAHDPPLLQQSSSRPRPRSRTATGVPDADDLLRVDTALRASRSPSRAAADKPSQWKKYMGRQVECVVCLEEYVDGVSRVMSLPCGHEFHAECITPWLTTRRRTCPICKGDVVRSLAKGSPSSPRYEPYHDDSDSDTEPEASGSGPRFIHPGADVEQGFSPALSPAHSVPTQSGRPDGWLGMLSSSFGTSSYGSNSFDANSYASSPRSHIRESEDRDR